jgi:methyltransferase (TIGR00027 family)
MEEGKPSGSAVFAALERAAHLYFDREPKIFSDDYALRFGGLKDKNELKTALESIHTKFTQLSNLPIADSLVYSWRAWAVVRHRYTEDLLQKALERGVAQYVILGAGLDSFAYRRRDLLNNLRVFEVDHPATQKGKKTRLKELEISLPDNLVFVPIDFEKQALMEQLRANGYQKSIPAFFSWLGTVHYLTEEAIFQTLAEVASAAPGSEIVFDYALPDSLIGEGERQIWLLGKANTEELVRSQMDPLILSQRLMNSGFSETRDFGPQEAYSLYLNGRTDDLSPTVMDGLFASLLRLFHIMNARVGKKL